MTTIQLPESERIKADTLLQKKQFLQHEKHKLFDKLYEIDREIIEVQHIYGQINNKHVPILKVPTEITCMIFTSSYTPVDKDKEDFEDAGYFSKEVVVSQVCHQWRRIALALPALWTKIYFDGPNSRRVPLHRIYTYLQRSGSRPLDLRLDFRETEQYPHGNTASRRNAALLQLALDHVARWKRVAITADMYSPVPPLGPLLRPLHAPNLEYLAMCYDTPCPEAPQLDGNPVDTAMIFDGGAPKLVNAWMDGVGSTLCLPPLSDITTLRIDKRGFRSDTTWPSRILLDILAVPSLTNLSLAGRLFDEPDSKELKPFTLKSLKHLRYSGDDALIYILPYFRAEHLETLAIHYAWIGVKMTTFLERAGEYAFPSLKELALVGTRVEPGYSALPLIHLTRSVQKLLFSNGDPIQCIFDRAPQIYDQGLWPNLEVITLNFDCTHAFHHLECYLMEMALIQPEPLKKLLVYRVPAFCLEEWQRSDARDLEILKRYCVVEEIVEDQILPRSWPPGDDIPAYIGVNADEYSFAVRVATEYIHDSDDSM